MEMDVLTVDGGSSTELDAFMVFFISDIGQLSGGGIDFPLHNDLQTWNK